MSHTDVRCQRAGCGNTFTVDDAQESARCPSCGEQHTPPWDGGSDGTGAPTGE